MQLVKKYEIQSKQKIIDFLNSQPVGRIASTDRMGYPQIIPMNFVYHDDAIYMHSHPFGEKLDNIRRNSNVGFEVDRHVCFLPSYFFHPYDASQADTLYISVVIKGKGEIIDESLEKACALNSLMEKYQKDGRYKKLDPSTPSVREVAIIKIIPREMHGKYKIGQHWAPTYRLKMARNILEREGIDNARSILAIMGIKLTDDASGLRIQEDPIM
jgi:uncharacterized protein